jgi:preprotein translocase subunit SecB
MSEEKKIAIQKIYIKDASLESPNSPHIFNVNAAEDTAPQVDVQFNIGNTVLTETLSEITLTLTVKAVRGDKSIYLVELVQGGIFEMKGFEDAAKHHIVGAYAPEVLFPYAREAVDSLLIKAGFPPLTLGPVNFEQFYRDNLKSKMEESAAASAADAEQATQH